MTVTSYGTCSAASESDTPRCTSAVVMEASAGANPVLKTKIHNWVRSNAMSIGPVKSTLLRIWLNQTITPTDVQRLVLSVWNDADYSRSFLDKIVSRF